jgi:hypothetical protein
MIPILLATTIASVSPQEIVNKQCSYIVGIPYASDNFSDDEWKRFQLCRKLIQQRKG